MLRSVELTMEFALGLAIELVLGLTIEFDLGNDAFDSVLAEYSTYSY